LEEQLKQCWEEFKKLDQLMDRRFGRQTPGLGDLKKSLEDIRSLTDRLLREKRAAEPNTSTASAENPDAGPAESGSPFANQGNLGPGSYAGPIASREEALRRLSEIALFFRKTEPHSPVSYLVQRAVHWGQMPLSRWLEDVIKDTAVLESLRETLGLKTDGETNS
jgi:type VI secretion system protein ImpA